MLRGLAIALTNGARSPDVHAVGARALGQRVRLTLWLARMTTKVRLNIIDTHSFTDHDLSVFLANNFDTHLAGHGVCHSGANDGHRSDDEGILHSE